MFQYEYHKPATRQEVSELLLKYGKSAKVLAGGTDLVVQMTEHSKRMKDIKHVIDLTYIKELRFIKQEGNTVRIGACATHTDIDRSELLREVAPFLPDAIVTIGSPKIRNTGTIGGNVANASPAADGLIPLVALDARVVIQGISGTREILLTDLFEAPYKLRVSEDEFLTEFLFEIPKNHKTTFVKLGRRKAMAISRMTVAVSLEEDQGIVKDIKLVPGCIFPTPRRMKRAEQLLIGKKITDQLLEEVARDVANEMIDTTGVRWSTQYKEPVIQSLVKRAILVAREEGRLIG